MSELKDRLLKQLETDYSEDARDCLIIYEALEEINDGRVPSDQWLVLTKVQFEGPSLDFARIYAPSRIGHVFLKGLKKKENEYIYTDTSRG